jgi:hypothetical protein
MDMVGGAAGAVLLLTRGLLHNLHNVQRTTWLITILYSLLSSVCKSVAARQGNWWLLL